MKGIGFFFFIFFLFFIPVWVLQLSLSLINFIFISSMLCFDMHGNPFLTGVWVWIFSNLELL